MLLSLPEYSTVFTSTTSMSDESEEKRPRLQLSRNLKPTEPEQPTEPSAAQKAEADTTQSAPKLRISKPELSSAKPQPEASPTKNAPPERQAPPPKIQKAAPPPIPQPSPQESPQQDKAAPAVEKNFDHLDSGTSSKKDTFSGLLIIIALLMILGAAAAGIFWVLKAPSGETDNAPTTTEEATTTAAQPANPIERAREAIDKVPVATVPEIKSTPVSTPPPAITPPPVTTEPPAITQPPIIPQEIPAQPTAPVSGLQQAVTQFLADAHIGGVRTGSSPRVTIGGETYNAGEVIDDDLNLTFEGIQDGRLLFKDGNGVHYLKSF